jgi:hypothetical protein
MKLLEEGFFPDCRRPYPHEDCVFQQDGAAPHAGKVTKVTKCFLEAIPDCNYTIWDSPSDNFYSARMEAFTENEQKDDIRENGKK